MLGRFRNSYAEINLQNLSSNYSTLKELVGGAGLAPMVKADAYGHGDVHVSRVLERLGARYLGVALIEEGIKLRMQGIQMPILVFGFFDSIGAEALIRYRLTPVLSDLGQIEKLKSNLHEGAAYPVHLKFNTGMNRLGFDPTSMELLAREMSVESFLKLEGICTHFVSSDDLKDEKGRTQEQVKIFSNIQSTLKKHVQSPLISHVSNSGGILSGIEKKYEVYRPGLSLYGAMASGNGFKPVLSLKSQVALIHKVKKGTTVSYNGIWKAPQDSLIAVVPLGYADGIPRAMSNKGRVLIHGEYCPIRGIICMDYFMVDVTSLKQVMVGDEIIILGKQKENEITALEMAENSGTIAYEILTGIQQRVPRIYVH